VHGIAIAGTDDHDEMGVFVEPPERVLGLVGPVPHYVFRTQPEGARSGPGDVDLVLYSLRKYLRLATKGNPTALLPLYAPPSRSWCAPRWARSCGNSRPQCCRSRPCTGSSAT
jgi:hypothetical protein